MMCWVRPECGVDLRPWIAFLLLVLIPGCRSQGFLEQPEDTTVKKGDDFLIACVTTPDLGGQLASLYWTRGANTLIPLSVFLRYSLEGNTAQGDYSLSVRGATDEDHDTWFCQVGSLTSVTAQVTLTDPPRNFHTLPFDDGTLIHTTAHDELSLFTSMDGGEPEPLISWYRNNDLVKTDRQRVSYYNVTLDMNDDTSTIRCEVTHVALNGPLMSILTLNVTFEPQPMSKPKNVTLDILDGGITVLAAVVGNPEPVITWEGEGHQDLTGDSLVITSDFQYSMAGEHRCWARNSIGETSCGTFTVTVTAWKVGLLMGFLPVVVIVTVVVTLLIRQKKKKVQGKSLPMAPLKIKAQHVPSSHKIDIQWTAQSEEAHKILYRRKGSVGWKEDPTEPIGNFPDYKHTVDVQQDSTYEICVLVTKGKDEIGKSNIEAVKVKASGNPGEPDLPE